MLKLLQISLVWTSEMSRRLSMSSVFLRAQIEAGGVDTCLCQLVLETESSSVPEFFGGLLTLGLIGWLLASWLPIKGISTLQEAFGLEKFTNPMIFWLPHPRDTSSVQEWMGRRPRGPGEGLSQGFASWAFGRTTNGQFRHAMARKFRTYKDRYR